MCYTIIRPRIGLVPTSHRLLAAIVAACWGFNFLAIDASLGHFPPFFLAALRFACIAIPTLLLVPRPQVETRWLVGYGLGFGTFQFLFLYWGMAAGMPAGLASLALQASGPFTVLLGVALLRAPLTVRAAAGVLLACAGLALVGWQRATGPTALIPFLLVLAGAFSWAIGNLCAAQAAGGSPGPTPSRAAFRADLARRRSEGGPDGPSSDANAARSSPKRRVAGVGPGDPPGAPNPLHLTLWMSVVPPLPMLALSLAVEGPAEIATSLTTWDRPTAVPALLGLAYTVLIATVIGSGIWSWLMARHAAGTVAPFSMLVPVVGMCSAWVLLGETVSPMELVGAAAVVTGVLIATARLRPKPMPHPGDPDVTPRSATPAAS